MGDWRLWFRFSLKAQVIRFLSHTFKSISKCIAPTPRSQALVHRSIDKYSKHIWEAQYETNAWYTNAMHEYDQEQKKKVKYTKWYRCQWKARRGGAQLKSRRLKRSWTDPRSKSEKHHPRTHLSTMRRIPIKWLKRTSNPTQVIGPNSPSNEAKLPLNQRRLQKQI